MLGEENKVIFFEFGVVEFLIKLFTYEDKIVRRNVTMIFGILVFNSKYEFLKIIK